MAFLQQLADNADAPEQIAKYLEHQESRRNLPAVASLFERGYWDRLWVVQEVFNAQDITIYCGRHRLSWEDCQTALQIFWNHKKELDSAFPKGISFGDDSDLSNGFAVSQVLLYSGPNSIPNITTITKLGEYPLLGVLRACRRKLCSDPRDKVFGILGLLPESIFAEFLVDYSLSVKEIYVDIVDFIIFTTERVDVLCEAIHFPSYTGSAGLPTWCPDWSHITDITALGHLFDFSASAKTKAECYFVDERRRQLNISAIHIDTIVTHGIAVGTLCTTSDYLVAFLHWRALLLNRIEQENKGKLKDIPENKQDDGQIDDTTEHDTFWRTLCLGQVPAEHNNNWSTASYHVFASLLRDRLPHLPLDDKLKRHLDTDVGIRSHAHRGFVHQHFKHMMGRCFCLTNGGLMGLGSGFMMTGDIVVVPLGCSTPILLRREGRQGYRFVGDVYIHGYMEGKAVEEWNASFREKKDYVLV
ncbi:hypothetical protein N0V90_006458 [Kalmusia sp. IMI 367209]|nr:hypothetical protein N0V90_006458 [Kalmusia sp. IMI 367209]